VSAPHQLHADVLVGKHVIMQNDNYLNLIKRIKLYVNNIIFAAMCIIFVPVLLVLAIGMAEGERKCKRMLRN